MNLDSQSSEDRAKWTPERPRLVIDAEKKKAEWTKAEPAESDTLNEDERVRLRGYRDQIEMQNREKARRAAVEKAVPSEPSIDDAERAKLDTMRARLAELRAVGESVPKWKKVAKIFGVGSGVAKNAGQISDAERGIRSQEALVRDLAGVPTNADLDATLAAMSERDPVFDDRLRFEFSVIGRMVGNKDLFGRLGVPVTNEERSRARETLTKILSFDDKVQAKWALAGLRLLDGYAAAFPTGDDTRAQKDLERAQELKNGPMELVGGKWVPYDSERPSVGLPTDNDTHNMEARNASTDSQGDALAA